MRQIDSIRRLFLGHRRLDDSGVAIVEFALVMPILLLMTFGAIEIGLMMATAATRLSVLARCEEGGFSYATPVLLFRNNLNIVAKRVPSSAMCDAWPHIGYFRPERLGFTIILSVGKPIARPQSERVEQYQPTG